MRAQAMTLDHCLEVRCVQQKHDQSQDRSLTNSTEDMTDRISTASKSHVLDAICQYDWNQNNA
jgi:hypothetical protein